LKFSLPGTLLFSRQWIETKDKAPIQKGWTEPENWKWYTDIRGGRGRGFVLNGFTVLDFDHVLNNGEWINEQSHEFYTELIERFPTWVELSMSGTGLHLWYRGECFDRPIRRLDFDKENRIGVDICGGKNRQVLVTGRVLVNNKMASANDTFRDFVKFQFGTWNPIRITKSWEKVWGNYRLKNMARRVLNQIDCSSLEYLDWLQVTSCCKQLGLFSEWDEWCQTNPEKYNVRENQCTWERCRPIAEHPVSYLRFFLKG
jgi:hypothetical protein